MSLDYEELPPRYVGWKMQIAGATCDVFGNNAWHPAHRRPVATLGRVEDGDKGNIDYWELDLCVICKNVAMAALRDRAKACGHIIPDSRDERFPK